MAQKIWETKSLSELCNIEIGKTPARSNKRFWDSEKTTENIWLSIADLSKTQNRIVNDSTEYISNEGAAISKIVSQGTLMVSFKLTLGRLAFAGKDLYTNEAIAALQIKNSNEILKEYLYYFLLFFDWDKAARGDVKVKGKTLNKKKLGKIEISFPDIREQKRLVALLDEIFEKLEKAKDNTEKNLKNSKEFFDSYLLVTFNRPDGNWEVKKWGELCHFVRGPFGGSLKKSIFKDKGFAVYEQKHAIHDHFEQLRYFIDEDKFNEMSRFEVKPGDIIMSCSGVTLGRVAIVPEGITRGIINQALLKLTPNKDISAIFLKYWLRSKIFQDIIFKFSGGAAIPNVPSAKILKEIKIPAPKLNVQMKIIGEIERFEKNVKRLEEIYQQKNAHLAELKQSILHQAFTGKL